MFRYFLHELKAKRGAVIGWGIGITVFVLLYVGLYPSFMEQVPDFEGLLDLPIYQALGVSTMATYPGWMASTVLNFMPLILGIYALIAGTRALVGEEEEGTLENIVTLPLARWQIVASKFLAILSALFLVLLIATLVTLAVTAWVETQISIDLGYEAISWAILSAYPLLALFAAIALFLGAFLPTRASANGVAIAFLIASYLSNNLMGQIESLKDLRFLSPFHYFNASSSAFVEGPAISDLITLSLLALVFIGLAAISFSRRDLMVHAWFWQRPRSPGVQKN